MIKIHVTVSGLGAPTPITKLSRNTVVSLRNKILCSYVQNDVAAVMAY